MGQWTGLQNPESPAGCCCSADKIASLHSVYKHVDPDNNLIGSGTISEPVHSVDRRPNFILLSNGKRQLQDNHSRAPTNLVPASLFALIMALTFISALYPTRLSLACLSYLLLP
jgi:hypothetical protein